MKKKVILCVVALLIIVILLGKCLKSSEDSNGNIANLGLVGKNNSDIYYNKYEKGIFRVTKGKDEQLTDETAYSINVVGNKIYYITVADFNSVVIKCVDKNREEFKKYCHNIYIN